MELGRSGRTIDHGTGGRRIVAALVLMAAIPILNFCEYYGAYIPLYTIVSGIPMFWSVHRRSHVIMAVVDATRTRLDTMLDSRIFKV